MELVRNEKYTEARQIFTRLAEDEPKNAEALNMLAYTQRKTGDLDVAIANYHRALELKPKFPEAREYLGEAYLQAALREAETLRAYAGAGREELAKLVDAFQAAAAQLESGDAGKAKSGGGW
jgi:Flp pilus assembly protein TadD